jgi:hypothetical protein
VRVCAGELESVRPLEFSSIETVNHEVIMPVEYDLFLTKPWAERVALFNAIPGDEKAQLVRTHVSRWLDSHRKELSLAQVEILEEWLAFITRDLYFSPKIEDSMKRLKDLETRTASLLSREQMRDALTMHWDKSCHVRRN